MQLYGGDSQSAGFGVVDGGTSTNSTPDILDGGDAITRFDPNYNGAYTQADISYFETGYITDTYFTAQRSAEVVLESNSTITVVTNNVVNIHEIEGGAYLTSSFNVYGASFAEPQFISNVGYVQVFNTVISPAVIPLTAVPITSPEARTYIRIVGNIND